MKKISNVFLITALILIFSYNFSYGIYETYSWTRGTDSIEASTNAITNNTNDLNIDANSNNISINSDQSISTNSNLEQNTSDSNSLNLESGSAILIEQSTGQIIYGKNIHEKLRPASVTKIMSILLIMEEIDSGRLSYSDKITCSENASSMGGSQIWLDPKESLTVDEMLKAICVVSANDCVYALSEHIAGSEEAFVQKMNDKAKELGMNDTTFKNCHGIDEDGHITSAYDIALMSRELLLKHPDITKYTTIWMDSLRNGKSQLVNTNKLIRTYKGITGLKTGSTSLALYNLSASATRDNLSLIAVIMKAPSTKIRFAEAKKLLDYGFSKYSYKIFGKKGDIIQEVSVKKGIKSSINAVLSDNAGALIEKGKENQVTQSIEINDKIEAPIKSGDIIGKVSFAIDGKEISSTNLISDSNVEKINFFTMSKKIIYKWIDLLRT